MFFSLECVPEVEHFIASPSAGNSHLQSVQKLTPFVPMSLFYGQLILVLTFDIFTIFFLNICFVSYLIFVSIKKNWLQLESFLLNVKYIEFSFRCQFCQFLCELQKMLWTSINQSQNQESGFFFLEGRIRIILTRIRNTVWKAGSYASRKKVKNCRVINYQSKDDK